MSFDAQQLGQALRSVLAGHPQVGELCVALSGGLDSMVLLHACREWLASDRQAAARWTLSALHVNHGLNPAADGWVSHCKMQCEARAVPLRAVRVEVSEDGGMGPEAAAREARYEAFASHLDPTQCLLLAHHRDDQAETLLLRLLRGAGVHGLAAMPASRSVGAGLLIRPLLNFSRDSLEAYALRHDLCWVEDSSNQDLALDRNLLRRRVLPLLRERWPHVSGSLQRSALLCEEAAQLNAELAALDLQPFARCKPARLQLQVLRQLSGARQRNALRYWLLGQGCSGVGHQLLGRIMDELMSDGESLRELQWRTWQLYRYRGWLYLQPALAALDTRTGGRWLLADSAVSLCGESLPLADNGALCLRPGGRLRLIPGSQELAWRYRQEGESCRLIGRPQKALKQVLQEAGVPPWLRDRLPLLLVDGQLASVPGVGVCQEHATDESEPGWQLSWRFGDWQFDENSFVQN